MKKMNEKQATLAFNKILKDVESMVGHKKTTFDKELNGIGCKLLNVKFK